MKNVLKLLVLAPLLIATTCEDDIDDPIRVNIYKASVTPQSSFNVDDIIWINGYV